MLQPIHVENAYILYMFIIEKLNTFITKNKTKVLSCPTPRQLLCIILELIPENSKSLHTELHKVLGPRGSSLWFFSFTMM